MHDSFHTLSMQLRNIGTYTKCINVVYVERQCRDFRLDFTDSNLLAPRTWIQCLTTCSQRKQFMRFNNKWLHRFRYDWLLFTSAIWQSIDVLISINPKPILLHSHTDIHKYHTPKTYFFFFFNVIFFNFLCLLFCWSTMSATIFGISILKIVEEIMCGQINEWKNSNNTPLDSIENERLCGLVSRE